MSEDSHGRKENKREILHKELSYKLIGLAMQVHRDLGNGFLEKVYENALMLLLHKEGIHAEQQAPIKVRFDSEVVGDYYADILVEDKIILEIKAVEKIINSHRAQALHYLKATGLRLSMILNFGTESFEFERLVL